MALLGVANYAPTTQANQDVSAAGGPWAIDTTNLRITFTAPASGKVAVRMVFTVRGNLTSSVIYLPRIVAHALTGGTTTSVGKGVASVSVDAPSSTVPYGTGEAMFWVSGLTAGSSYTWEPGISSAYTCTSGMVFWGGTTGGDAGPSQFEIYG